MTQPITLAFHGAALRVTGSCCLAQFGPTRILIDCGLIQGDDDAQVRNRAVLPFDAASLDAVVLTHGHLDHVGRLPLLLQGGFAGPIVTHAATAPLAEIVLRDTVRLSAQEEEPLYDDALVNQTIARMRPLSYGQEVRVGDVRLRLFDAGHILGSAHVLFDWDGKRVLFSGDVGQLGSPIIRDPTSRWDAPVEALVVESTYGNRVHKGRAETEEEFRAIVRRVVADRGVVLIPAFAIGRTQELLYRFSDLMESGAIPRLPVLLDSPMANRVTEVYRAHSECYDQETKERLEQGSPMAFDGLRQIVSAEQSKQVRGMPPPFIVIAGSGMCTGGRILHHLVNFLDKPSTTVLFVGWQGVGTLGRRLVDGERAVTIMGRKVEVRARIETLNGFSAHADRDALLAWARAIPGAPPSVLVNHGEEAAARALAVSMAQIGLGTRLCQAVELGSEYRV